VADDKYDSNWRGGKFSREVLEGIKKKKTRSSIWGPKFDEGGEVDPPRDDKTFYQPIWET